MSILQGFVICGVLFVGNNALQRIAIRPQPVKYYETGWDVGPTVGSIGELNCFHGMNTFNASIETQEEAQRACSLDEKCNFIWSHDCSGRWWKCYGEAPMVQSGDRSSCTLIKVEMRRTKNNNSTPVSRTFDVTETKLVHGQRPALVSTAAWKIRKMNRIVNAAHPESRDGYGMHPSLGDYSGVNVAYVDGAKLRNLNKETRGARVSSGNARMSDAAHEVKSNSPDLARHGRRFSLDASQQEISATAVNGTTHQSYTRHSTVKVAFEWGPTVGSNGKLHCFRGGNSFSKSIKSQEEAQAACRSDQKCSFIWSHKCSGRWWKCYGEAPMVESGDRSSCTLVKVAERPKASIAMLPIDTQK